MDEILVGSLDEVAVSNAADGLEDPGFPMTPNRTVYQDPEVDDGITTAFPNLPSEPDLEILANPFSKPLTFR